MQLLRDEIDAGTDSLVQAVVLRDGAKISVLNVDCEDENDLERGALRNYHYFDLDRRNDQTPELPAGIGQSPMPYPDYGLEFSNGVAGHLKLRLRINGSDMWIKDNVKLFVREIREQATSFDTFAWQEDPSWSFAGNWSQDVPMSTDGSDGVATWSLKL